MLLKTPFFSRLAKEGLRFTHNAVTTSTCWMSSQEPHFLLGSGGVGTPLNCASTYMYLSRPVFASDATRWRKTWPFILQRAGYWVGHVGKWQYQILMATKPTFQFFFFL